MSKLNKPAQTANRTHEGAPTYPLSAERELTRSVLACMLWEDSFYESGQSIADRIAALVPKVPAPQVYQLVTQARTWYKLRHAPLLLISEMCKHETHRPFVASALQLAIQRPDELCEFLAIYWKDTDRKKRPLAAQAKKGLAAACSMFNEYEFAKYDRDNAIKLRDVLRIVHPVPQNQEQAQLFKKIIDGTLETPDTWEVALSSGANKKETFERLMTENKLGALALLRNLRKMGEEKVNPNIMLDAIEKMNTKRVLPFRFWTANRHAPVFCYDALEKKFLESANQLAKLPGTTYVLVDVSGSMDAPLAQKSEVLRLDAASCLAAIARQVCGFCRIFSFSYQLVEIATSRGFSLHRDIVQSQEHGGTYLGGALKLIQNSFETPSRIIIITDEQSQDAVEYDKSTTTYVLNVASYQNSVAYGSSVVGLTGFSENLISYITELEKER